MTETDKKPELGDVKEKDDCIYIYNGTEYVKCTSEEYFTVEGNTIINYDFNGGINVVIPPKINGFTIKNIGDNSFEYPGSGPKLTSVVFPNTIKTIGKEAFYGNELTELKLPDSVEEIGIRAFYGNNIKELIFSNLVKKIGERAFANNNLENLTIPGLVKIIGDCAFNQNKLTNLIIPNSIKTMGKEVFEMNGPNRNSFNITDWHPGKGGTWQLSGQSWIKQ